MMSEAKRFYCSANLRDVIYDLRRVCSQCKTFTFSVRNLNSINEYCNVTMYIGGVGVPVDCVFPFKLKMTKRMVSDLYKIVDLICKYDQDGRMEISGFSDGKSAVTDTFRINFELYPNDAEQYPWNCGKSFVFHGWKVRK